MSSYAPSTDCCVVNETKSEETDLSFSQSAIALSRTFLGAVQRPEGSGQEHRDLLRNVKDQCVSDLT